jgi:hypothetical protein
VDCYHSYMSKQLQQSVNGRGPRQDEAPRRWARALSGKGAGQIGFLVRMVGASSAIIRFPDAPFPHDVVKKQVRTIEFLRGAENWVCEAQYAERAAAGLPALAESHSSAPSHEADGEPAG